MTHSMSILLFCSLFQTASILTFKAFIPLSTCFLHAFLKFLLLLKTYRVILLKKQVPALLFKNFTDETLFYLEKFSKKVC